VKRLDSQNWTASSSGMFLVKLTGSLEAPEDPESPTSAEGVRYYVSGVTGGISELSPDDTSTVTIINYSPGVDGAENDIVWCEKSPYGGIIALFKAN